MNINIVKKYKIISIIRGYNVEDTIKIVEKLYKAGIKLVEVTLNSPDALNSIKKLNELFADDMYIGAGTVMTANECQNAIDAGANFIISPNINSEVIQCTKENNVISIPGALTPSEITYAINIGADIVKVFPVSEMGVGYIKDIRAPLNDVKLLPTGGIDKTNIRDYIDEGAIGVGVSSSIVKGGLDINDLSLNEIEQKAKSLVKKLN
ncbi:bifunctional 4-hydroxy-2-oxoglutarate aldolase/2-dehydro-3-deoxy-phosphogluconate aldolase [Staphylococcus kloosii]|uniref:bifunctional 4-hydroxy-2-oxoglutarate aldolase/2-dehydro-3-deoxy-phosphogluconate aldolase n=1 Tax=Staphylococcus kloosii TaxID=29384 RepID=UPI0028A34C30|nr:bifunctional 4-hydroxy-2-oxoglutarate aldolase/2-dehydro-3-deoxy-phosphogluconate aldolase [Staphylococcus kloosii]MDT3958949.1 bifunctional 4-hydroxy-2-oxoglutarate aldolase/2-dehydro-3-deoxy-phosphogluconate aldolase [Staphylococcus kloosii]